MTVPSFIGTRKDGHSLVTDLIQTSRLSTAGLTRFLFLPPVSEALAAPARICRRGTPISSDRKTEDLRIASLRNKMVERGQQKSQIVDPVRFFRKLLAAISWLEHLLL
jgi:hypothetical protein